MYLLPLKIFSNSLSRVPLCATQHIFKDIPKIGSAWTRKYAGCCDSAIRGKVVIITGGAVGIGKAFARELLKNCARVIAIGDIKCKEGEQTVAELNKEFGCNSAVFIKCDVSSTKEMEGLFDCVKKNYQCIGLVINNAGILNDNQWRLSIDTNCSGVALGSLLGVKHMGVHNGGPGGLVVNVSSLLGLKGSPSSPIYAGTKHFVIGLTRSMGDCFHYKVSGVQFMALCPGVTDTALISDAGKGALTSLHPEMKKKLLQDIKARPTQKPEVVACNLIQMIKCGGNGSVWIAKNSELFEIYFPDPKQLRVKK